MKYIIKFLALFTTLLTMFSCDEESNFKEPDIALVPVYSITNIVDDPFIRINIYQERPLIIDYTSEVNPVSFVSSGYSDTSTATNYEISVNKIVDGNTIAFTISGDKASGIGTLTAVSDVTTVSNVMISDEEIFN